MQRIEYGGHVFEIMDSEPLEVTSMRRPHTGWRFVDAAGHEHSWYVNGQPANGYNPQDKHSTPTLRWVVDRDGYYPDGEAYDIGHHECAICGERVEPQYIADDTPQYIPGIRQIFIDGRPVSEEEARLIAERVGLI